ncbi:hypothetical protein DRP04_09530 [Archaeoglobales archaeon]|nr:MAG: hypothetical protein DRP04_09530 [Archaeoglobales archaeon]
MRKFPFISDLPEDIKDLLDPLQLRKKVGTIFNTPEIIYNLFRLLGEMLITMKELNERMKSIEEKLDEFNKKFE